MKLNSKHAALHTALAVTLVAASGTRNALAQVTTRASLSAVGLEANNACVGGTISDNGQFVTISSRATNLVAGVADGREHVYVRDLFGNQLEHVCVSTLGVQADAECNFPRISTSGRFVVFESAATNLVPGDTNARADVFLRDLQAQTTELVSLSYGGTPANGASSVASISADGRFVVFESDASNLVVGDTNGRIDVFVRDRVSGTTEFIDVNPTGAPCLLGATQGAISGGGRYVTFSSWSADVVAGDNNLMNDVFVRDRSTGITERVSVNTLGAEGNGVSTGGTVSNDGRFVVFGTTSTNLDGGGSGGGTYHVIVRDRRLARTERVDVTIDGTPLDSSGSFYAWISGDGRFVVFVSEATNLIAGDTNGQNDVFLRDLLLHTTERVNVTTAGTAATIGTALDRSRPLSSNARHVVFYTPSALDAGDTNLFNDVYVRTRAADPTPFCFGDGVDPGHTAACPCGNTGGEGNGCAHSFDPGGANLSGTGHIASDSFRLIATREPATSYTMFLQHDAPGDSIFHDGVSCAGGVLRRLRGRAASAGGVTFPDSAFAVDATTTLSQRGGVAPGQGVRRYYSAWFRNASTTFCPPATANVTNGLQIDW